MRAVYGPPFLTHGPHCLMLPSVLAFLSVANEGLQSTTDAVSQALVAVILIGVFVFLTLEAAHRVLVILGAVALMWLITYLTPYHLVSFEASKQALDLNVLLLLAAMMATVGVLKTTGVFPWAVAQILRRARGRPWVIQRSVAWFTGVVSAFADNVTTVVFVTPMAADMARQTRVRPVVYLLPMVMASNIGGSATLIGDPPNIMIGSGAHLTFLDFIEDLTVPVIFMMIALEWFSRWYYRHDLTQTAGVATAFDEPVIQNRPLLRYALAITAGIFIGFFTHGLTGMPVAVPALIGAALILIIQDIIYLRTNRPSEEERSHGLIEVIENEIEWPTLSFFAFLFIAVGAAVETGLIDRMAQGLIWTVEAGQRGFGLGEAGTLLFAALMICWVSAVCSSLIDNIPFVAVAIPLVARLTASLPGDTAVLWWALALGACLGGNGTVIGASANVTTVGLAEKSGARISFMEFTRFGAAVTTITLLISSVFLASYTYVGKAMTFYGGLIGLVVLSGSMWLIGRIRGPSSSRAT